MRIELNAVTEADSAHRRRRHERGREAGVGGWYRCPGWWYVSVVFAFGSSRKVAATASMRSTLTRAPNNLWTCVTYAIAGETTERERGSVATVPDNCLASPWSSAFTWWSGSMRMVFGFAGCHVKRPLSHNVAPWSMPGEFSLFLCWHFRFLLLLLPFRLLLTALSQCATSCKN